MKNSLLPLLFLSTFLVLSLPAPVADAFDGNETEAEAEPETPFDLQFGGGSVPELVDHIAEQTGRPPPVIIEENARTMKIPPFELASVTVDQVFTALARLMQLSDSHSGYMENHKGYWIIARSTSREDTRVFQIGPYLARFQLDDITTAIETGWEMAGVEATGRLRYHEETMLLYVRGSGEQLSVVAQILKELQSAPEPQSESR